MPVRDRACEGSITVSSSSRTRTILGIGIRSGPCVVRVLSCGSILLLTRVSEPLSPTFKQASSSSENYTQCRGFLCEAQNRADAPKDA